MGMMGPGQDEQMDPFQYAYYQNMFAQMMSMNGIPTPMMPMSQPSIGSSQNNSILSAPTQNTFSLQGNPMFNQVFSTMSGPINQGEGGNKRNPKKPNVPRKRIIDASQDSEGNQVHYNHHVAQKAPQSAPVLYHNGVNRNTEMMSKMDFDRFYCFESLREILMQSEKIHRFHERRDNYRFNEISQFQDDEEDEMIYLNEEEIQRALNERDDTNFTRNPNLMNNGHEETAYDSKRRNKRRNHRKRANRKKKDINQNKSNPHYDSDRYGKRSNRTEDFSSPPYDYQVDNSQYHQKLPQEERRLNHQQNYNKFKKKDYDEQTETFSNRQSHNAQSIQSYDHERDLRDKISQEQRKIYKKQQRRLRQLKNKKKHKRQEKQKAASQLQNDDHFHQKTEKNQRRRSQNYQNNSWQKNEGNFQQKNLNNFDNFRPIKNSQKNIKHQTYFSEPYGIEHGF